MFTFLTMLPPPSTGLTQPPDARLDLDDIKSRIFLMVWIMANIIGWMLAWNISMYVSKSEDWLAAATFALPISMSQWLVIRRWVSRPQMYLLNNFVGLWLGVLLGYTIADDAYRFVRGEDFGVIWVYYFGLTLAITFTIVQWLFWRTKVRLVYLALPLSGSILLITIILTWIAVLWSSNGLIATILGGAIYGGLSGIVFLWMLQHPLKRKH